MINAKYKILLDINQDVKNWYDGVNGHSVGKDVDWASRVSDDIVKQIRGKTRDEAYNILLPYLEDMYRQEFKKISYITKILKSEFELKFDKACEELSKITGKPLSVKEYTIYQTTFPRGPYNYEESAMWMPLGWLDPIRIFMHEALHFEFIYYWAGKTRELSDEQFEWVKESLTVVIDDSLKPLIEKADSGYELHQSYRDELHKNWNKNHNFDDLVSYAIKILPQYLDMK